MPLTMPYSSSSAISRGSAPVSSTTSSSEYSAPRSRRENVRRRSAAPGRPSGAAAAGPAGEAGGRPGARGGGGLGRLHRAPGRELLPDDAQRQELVALQAQDRPQPRDVVGRVQPGAAGRAPRREQLLVLEVADLRDRDVRELLLERLADRADGQRLGLPRRLGRNR